MLVNAALPDGYVEGIGYGMIGWVVPLERYPDTYNKPAARPMPGWPRRRTTIRST